MRRLRRGRVPAAGGGSSRREGLLSRLVAPALSLVILAILFAVATGPQPPRAPGAGSKPSPSAGVPTQAAATGTTVTFSAAAEPEPAELATFYAASVSWSPCDDDDTFDCARVRVPLDYTKPDGETVSVSLRRLEAADPPRRLGTLFINPGGPGVSGIEFVEEAPTVFGDEVRDRYDIVGFDPRGMGESDGFDCLTDAELDSMYAADPTPRTTAGRAQLARDASARLAACQRRGGALAANMGTESVARDLDILRSAVGDERLNYYGVSYGTLIGAMYADFFTSRVGLMVLDSAVVPEALNTPVPTQEEVDWSARGWAAAFDDSFDAFVEECGSSITCPLGDDTEEASLAVLGFLDRLERGPMPTEFESLPRLTEGWAVTAIDIGLRDPSSWTYLVDALDAAMHDDDANDLAQFAMIATQRNEDGTYAAAAFGRSHLPVSCADWPITPWEAAVPSKDVLANHPLWARIQPFLPAECEGWAGKQRETLLVGAEVATPVLVIGNEGDGVTPIEDTEMLADALLHSRFVRVEADGHGAYGYDNDCADEVVDAYLARAIAPENGTVCAAS